MRSRDGLEVSTTIFQPTLKTNNTLNGIRKMNKLDKHKFWLAVFLCVAGVGLLFVGMLVNPVGVISASVIGGAGELFLTAGAILGIDAIYSPRRMSKPKRQGKT